MTSESQCGGGGWRITVCQAASSSLTSSPISNVPSRSRRTAGSRPGPLGGDLTVYRAAE
jgi:hypothetical protein